MLLRKRQSLMVRFLSSSTGDNNAGSGSGGSGEEKTEEEKAIIKAAREERKAEKDRKKADKKAKKAATAAAAAEAAKEEEASPVTYLSVDEQSTYPTMGDYTMVASRSRSGRSYAHISNLADSELHPHDSNVWIRGRLHSIRIKGGSCFLVLRQDSFHTAQVCFFRQKDNDNDQKMISYLKTLTEESIIDVYGTVVTDATVKGCSLGDVELTLNRIHAVSKSAPILPFGIEDASRTESEIIESQQTSERPYSNVGQEQRLDHRWIDLRTPANAAIFRIKAAICGLYREALNSKGFVEIQTPKILPGESEGGSESFNLDYFGKAACLAQSPQLYKQMSISGDMGKIFEIGPVFRAEKSFTRRHLTEFVGLDLEMCIDDHYMEVVEVLYGVLSYIFCGLEEQHSDLLAKVRNQYPSEPAIIAKDPCVLSWNEGMEMLRLRKEEAVDIETDEFELPTGEDDLTTAQELALGRAVREKYKTDLFVLTGYPSLVRPFYTMPSPADSKRSNSYDIFLRGREICSGAQRVHDSNLLVDIMKAKGISDDPRADEGLRKYIESFDHGMPPHGGGGLGLERVVTLYLGLDNVRKSSMFPRDPNRYSP